MKILIELTVPDDFETSVNQLAVVLTEISNDRWRWMASVEKYLKPGETIQACIERNRNDVIMLLGLLQQARDGKL